MVGQVGRKRQKRKNIFYEPTFSIPPLTIMATPPGSQIPHLWEMVDAERCTLLKQIIIVDSEKQTAHIPFRTGALNRAVVDSTIKRQKLNRVTQVITLGDPEEQREMEEITKHLITQSKIEDQPLGIEDGLQIEGQMLAPVSEAYLRALAKIGFHFFLQHFRSVSGREAEFDPIKRFIYSGAGTASAFVRPCEHEILVGLGKTLMLKQWSHLLCFDCDEHGIRSRIQFFAGPKVVPIVWEVEIGQNPSKKHGQHGLGVAYAYYPRLEGEYHGQKVPLELSGVQI